MKGNNIGFNHAINGILVTVKTERNLRIHLVIALIVIITGFVFNLSQLEWLFIIVAIASVIVTELINSIIERLIDYLKPEINLQAKEIKDMSAGIVLFTCFISVIIGLVIFLPKIY